MCLLLFFRKTITSCLTSSTAKTTIFAPRYTFLSRTGVNNPLTRFLSSSATIDEDLLTDESFESQLFDSNYSGIKRRGYNVLIVQPKVKWGPNKTSLYTKTTPELQLQESIALVESLEEWKVIDSLIMSTTSLNKRHVFGSGQIGMIKEMAERNKSIDGVMINIDILVGWKQKDLQEMIGLPIFDRFSIILHIFQSRAKTKEAKIQASLAELFYIKSRLRQTSSESTTGLINPSNIVIGSNPLSIKKEIIKEREKRLTLMLKEMKESRSRLRSNRLSNEIPCVSIIGYTNSGKTSLIKSLTRNQKIEPQNILFHTLEVKVFETRLRNIPQVLFMDSIGFIADLPKELMECFKESLEEINLTHLMIHVLDVSHPDVKNQRLTVLQTLKDMNVNQRLMTSMIEVGNKVDKVLQSDERQENQLNNEARNFNQPKVDLLISATKSLNIKKLEEEIEKRLFISLGCFFKRLRVGNGSPEYQFLLKNAFILENQVDEKNPNFVNMTTKMTEAVAGRFRKTFPHHNFFHDDQDDDGDDK